MDPKLPIGFIKGKFSVFWFRFYHDAICNLSLDLNTVDTKLGKIF